MSDCSYAMYSRAAGHWLQPMSLNEELVEQAVMSSVYYGERKQSKVKYTTTSLERISRQSYNSNDQLTNFIDLSIGVLQGDTLLSTILLSTVFVIVVDYVMRVALADQSLARLEDYK
jgi:hypothetical protein